MGGDTSTEMMFAMTAAALADSDDERKHRPPPSSRVQREGPPVRVLTDDEAWPLLYGGDYESAKRAMRLDWQGYHQLHLAVWMMVGISIYFLTLDLWLGHLDAEPILAVFRDIGVLLFLGVVLLVYAVYPANNPVRVSIRRFATACCFNSHYQRGLAESTLETSRPVLRVFAYLATCAALVLTSVLKHSATARENRNVVTATIAMWLIGLILALVSGELGRFGTWLIRHAQ